MGKKNDDESNDVLHKVEKKDIRYCVARCSHKASENKKEMGSNGTAKSDDITKKAVCATPSKKALHCWKSGGLLDIGDIMSVR